MLCCCFTLLGRLASLENKSRKQTKKQISIQSKLPWQAKELRCNILDGIQLDVSDENTARWFTQRLMFDMPLEEESTEALSFSLCTYINANATHSSSTACFKPAFLAQSVIYVHIRRQINVNLLSLSSDFPS